MVMVMAKRGCNMIPHYIMNNMGFIKNTYGDGQFTGVCVCPEPIWTGSGNGNGQERL